MDEVDGMGAGDRSGMAELIQMIKKSKVPIVSLFCPCFEHFENFLTPVFPSRSRLELHQKICICNDRQSQKVKSLAQYCLDLRYRRPTKGVIAKRAMHIGKLEGMEVEQNAAEAMAESCGNDIRQVLNSLQMWSCKRRSGGTKAASVTYRDLRDRQSDINKDEVLRVSMFDACRTICEGAKNLAGADARAANASLMKRTDAYFVDYALMGLMVHQNYPKVLTGMYNRAKVNDDDEEEEAALDAIYDATEAMSDFGLVEEHLRGGDQNWSLLPLCSILAVKVGHHAGGPNGGFVGGNPEFAGWLGKNSSRGKRMRLLQELRRHLNHRVSADAPELRMNYLPVMRQQFSDLLFRRDGARVSEAIQLMDEYGLDRDDVFESFDEFLFAAKEFEQVKFADLDSKSKAAFTRAYNTMAHTSQALVSEQGAEKKGRKKGGSDGAATELDVVDDDKNVESEEEDHEENAEELLKKFGGKKKKKKAAKTAAGKKGKKK